MMNLSSLSKSYLLTLAAILFAALGFASAYLHAGLAIELGLNVLTMIALAFNIYFTFRTKWLLKKISNVFLACRRGDLEARITHAKENGDLKELVDNANNLIDVSDAYVRESKAALEHASREKFYRKVLRTGLQGSFLQAVDLVNSSIDVMEQKTQALYKMADDLEVNVGVIVSAVAAAATQLSQTAEIMVAQVTAASGKSSEVASTSSQTSANVQSVASAAEEMSASAKVIAHQMQMVNQAVNESSGKATDAGIQAELLQQASQSIGEIAGLIEKIAGQINLLALNATIESARAGEVGKGFAVVAGEVKNLANQTAKATEEISNEIANVQQVVANVVKGLAEIGSSFKGVTESTSAVASAVEEQTAVTNEISSNMQSASSGVENVNQNIGEIAGSIKQVEEATRQVQEAARSLSQQSELLNKEVQEFLNGITSAHLIASRLG